MAPINKRPFLEYQFDFLIRNGIEHIVLAVGYLANSIIDCVGYSYKGIKIDYSRENVPLGTGGAIKQALKYCSDKDVFIVNGDTFFDVNFNEMKLFHAHNKSSLTIAVTQKYNIERYGVVKVKNNKITEFYNKGAFNQGLINGGVYLINKDLLFSIEKTQFSFEREILESRLFDVYAFESNGYFIDIGVPEDYHKAEKDFLNFKKLIVKSAVFLDRDGTINEETNYLSKPSDFKFIKGVPEAIKIFHEKNFLVIVITNQAGVAKGYFDEESVNILHRYVNDKLNDFGTYVDSFYYCPHHPQGKIESYRKTCNCRKPAPGLIKMALADYMTRGISIDVFSSYIVGDTEKDVLTGKNVGIGKKILLRSGHPIDESTSKADEIFNSLIEFAESL